MLAVDSDAILNRDAFCIGYWIGVSRKIIRQRARKTVVKGAIPRSHNRCRFIVAKYTASVLSKAKAGKALKAIVFCPQVAVIRQAAVNAAPGFCPAFIKRKTGSQLPIEIAIEIIAIASVKIGTGGKLPAPPDIGRGIDALLVLQIEAPIVGGAIT